MIWRYLDLAKFISMLQTSSIYFLGPTALEETASGAPGS